MTVLSEITSSNVYCGFIGPVIKASTCCLSLKTDYFVRRPLLCKIFKVRTDWVITYYLVRVISYWDRSPHETKTTNKQTNISEQTFL